MKAWTLSPEKGKTAITLQVSCEPLAGNWGVGTAWCMGWLPLVGSLACCSLESCSPGKVKEAAHTPQAFNSSCFLRVLSATS